MVKNTPGIPPRHAVSPAAVAGGLPDRTTRRIHGIPPRSKEAAAGKIPVRQTMNERKQFDGDDINESAEAFIRKFRQELLRQNAESNNRHEHKKLAREL